MSSIELFRDTLLRVTTNGGCKVSRQKILVAFTKANKRKKVIGNVTSCYKLVKSVERQGITATPTNGESFTSYLFVYYLFIDSYNVQGREQ